MILLDTHVWIWWINSDARLTDKLRSRIDGAEPQGWALSVISCWEVAMLVEKGRLELDRPTWPWVQEALAPAGLALFGLTAEIAVASRNLPGAFHPDPADRIIVATARHLDLPVLTVDRHILNYPHVKTIT